jgi:hypothetical protein
VPAPACDGGFYVLRRSRASCFPPRPIDLASTCMLRYGLACWRCRAARRGAGDDVTSSLVIQTPLASSWRMVAPDAAVYLRAIDQSRTLLIQGGDVDCTRASTLTRAKKLGTHAMHCSTSAFRSSSMSRAYNDGQSAGNCRATRLLRQPGHPKRPPLRPRTRTHVVHRRDSRDHRHLAILKWC